MRRGWGAARTDQPAGGLEPTPTGGRGRSDEEFPAMREHQGNERDLAQAGDSQNEGSSLWMVWAAAGCSASSDSRAPHRLPL